MMFFKKQIALTALVIAATLLTRTISAQLIQDKAAGLETVDVIEHLGDTVPTGLSFVDDHGREVTINSYLHHDKPVILVMGYYECPMLCNLVFNGLVETMREMNLKPGIDFTVVTISINPRENAELARAKKQNYLSALDIPSADSGWVFLTGEEAASLAFADAIGFKYRYDEEIQQYAHPALLTMLSPEGKITRYLYGIEFVPNDLRLALLEAADGRIGNTLDKILLYCYHYDPDAKGYVVFAGNVMRLGGAVTLVLMALLVGTLLYRERRKRKHFTASLIH